MDFLNTIPVMDRTALRELKKGIDLSFKDFSRAYGDGIESFFDPLLYFLIWLEKLLVNSPWPLVIGALMSKSSRAEKAILPILDMMQTIPSFVYLIPIIMLLGIGKVPGLLAVCIYALPPVVRLTNLGIREVDKETLEASEAFGATPMQKLKSVQIPLSLPTIFAGINQTIMMALAMVVIASMIGVKGLGVPILQAISNQYLALGMMNGLAIVALAILFDRVTQKYGERIQKHRGQKK